ncbi:hypothetical protein SAMN02745244_00552 [Tessaracoccus bendigoensis DSM 12906]|uniref:Uncharacterized protein n=1 Tax=Tessaracoccus bendigoensis DSM 12906 TaxID=1123357 RepID=A0A1M6BZ37_9ACTN|nr:hypothetical protein [Tessaracoccus bendigoensis]SHI53708.1 hypothetical protein SAMN02745244_00552 [Tessaracoccus bendigoensis DSM 12906]
MTSVRRPPSTQAAVEEPLAFQGELLSVTALLARSLAEPDQVSADRSLRHDAASNAVFGRLLLAEGEELAEVWRLAVLQTLDDYSSALKRGGVELAQCVFHHEPALTGSAEIDAAFAGLAEYLADRDGWVAPEWTSAAATVARWYPGVPRIFREDADRESPPAFRRRGIFITDSSLARA